MFFDKILNKNNKKLLFLGLFVFILNLNVSSMAMAPEIVEKKAQPAEVAVGAAVAAQAQNAGLAVNAGAQNNAAVAAGGGANADTWKAYIARAMIKTSVMAFIGILVNPAFFRAIAKFFSSSYAAELELKELMKINDSLRTQLSYVKAHCGDRKVIRELEKTYLDSCVKVMNLQKKHMKKCAA